MELPFNPLDRGLNVAVMHIAGRYNPCGFDVSAEAPATFPELKQHVSQCGRLTVWNGNSEDTVFDDAEVNWHFRAWHDAVHLAIGADFSLLGEYRCYQRQWQDIVTLYGESPRTHRWRDILYAEIMGQAMYYHDRGNFPVNQRQFVESFLSGEVRL